MICNLHLGWDSVKVHIFWEGHKNLQNLHQLFALCTASQIIGGDFEKFYGLLRIYELLLKKWLQNGFVHIAPPEPPDQDYSREI